MSGRRWHAEPRVALEAVGVGFDAPERRVLKGVDIDPHLGPQDVELHQINEGRAPGKKLGLLVPFRSPGGRENCSRRRTGPFEQERPHLSLPGWRAWLE